MGIKKLFELLEGKVYTPAQLLVLDPIVGVDAFSVLFECLTSGIILTDSNGRVTHHITTLTSKITNLPKRQVWVFDNPKKNVAKLETIKQRARYPKDVFEKIPFKTALKDLKDLLDLMGVPYTTSPEAIEAEQYLVEMFLHGKIHCVLSKDSDVLVYGGDLLVFKDKKFTLYKYKKVLKRLNLTDSQFVQMCCLLGNDFNPTAAGISTTNAVGIVRAGTTLSNQELISYIIFRKRVYLQSKDIELIGQERKVTTDLIEHLGTFDIKALIPKLEKMIQDAQ
jgi:5'-3' exonuclease